MVEEEKRDMIAEANAAAEKIRIEREKMEETFKKMQELETRNILGGKSSAGEPPKPELTTAEKIKLDQQKYFKGTGAERYFK